MDTIYTFQKNQDLQGLIKYLATEGDHFSESDLQSIKVNIIQRAMNDNFQQSVDASILPKLVDLLIELKLIQKFYI